VYSFGICLYELLTGLLPYDDIKNRDQIMFMVGSGLLRPHMDNIRTDTPRRLLKLLEQCIRYSRDDRPEFKCIYTILDTIRLPKLKKSASEPILSGWSKNASISMSNLGMDGSSLLNSSAPRTPGHHSHHHHHHQHRPSQLVPIPLSTSFISTHLQPAAIGNIH
jgi:serine/threonine protein kinase